MKIESLRLCGIRCFEDTGTVELSSGCNVFIGPNNAGKSSILRAISSWQLSSLAGDELRIGADNSWQEIVVSGIRRKSPIQSFPGTEKARFVRTYKGSALSDNIEFQTIQSGHPTFRTDWPMGFMIAFAAKRKASAFNEAVNLASQQSSDGTFAHLYARIDRVASPGTDAHEFYKQSVEEILGVFITTSSSPHGKQAGYYFDEYNFIPLERMGDGVAEIVALIVELSLAKDKLFILEEPETNLHPKGLKALLNLIRASSLRNQFIIATHSNIVVRELGAATDTKVFRVYREIGDRSGSSTLNEVPRSKAAHREVLEELGYEFGDLDLHDYWLMLEEASAETVIRDILIPMFVPELTGKIRTFSAAGVTNLEPRVSEFQRLVTFVHLEPVYQDRLWVRADGDDVGRQTIQALRAKFPYLAAPKADVFARPNFEEYYPSPFAEAATLAVEEPDKAKRREAKAALLQDVLSWSSEDVATAKEAWAQSAKEVIAVLKQIR